MSVLAQSQNFRILDPALAVALDLGRAQAIAPTSNQQGGGKNG
jgi:hypothetical protein